MDRLFTAKNCDRCGKVLTGRWLSMFNMDVICPECKAKEKTHPDYQKAVEAVDAEYKKGTKNFEGIGYKEVK